MLGCDNSVSDKNLVYVPLLEVDQLLAPRPVLFENPKAGLWLDPRLPAQYEAGHIPGAISMPFPTMLTVAKSQLQGQGAIIVYDTNYDDILGKAGAKRLMELGIKNVYNLQGGLDVWQKAGHPIVTGPNPN